MIPQGPKSSESSVPKQRLVAAIVFTDMVGYSGLAARDEGASLELLKEQRALVRPLIAEHRGTEIKTIGDAFLLVFDSASDALACAVAVQRTLARRNLEHAAEPPILLRIGIHYGEVFRAPNDILGDNVNIAARLYPLAEPGGICVSQEVVEQAGRNSAGVHRFVKLGEAELKHVARRDVFALAPDSAAGRTAMRARFLLRQSRWKRRGWIAVAVLVLASLWPILSYFKSPAIDHIAVSDVVNTTGERALDGLSGMLVTSLEQSRRIRVVPRTRLVDVMREEGWSGSALDEAAARQACRIDGLRTLVIPDVRRTNDEWIVRLRVLDLDRDRVWLELSDATSERSAIPGLVDKLSSRLRLELFEQASDVEGARVALGEATTSLEAYQHYFAAEQKMNGWDFVGAANELDEATKLDPEFGLAHVQLAYVYQWNLDPRGRPAIERALALESRIRTRRERAMLHAMKARLDEDDEKAAAILRELVQEYPLDKTARFELGDVYFHRSDFGLAADVFEETLRLDSAHQRARDHLVWALYGAGRGDEAIARAEAWVDRTPSTRAWQQLVDVYAAVGRTQDALRAIERGRRGYGDSLPEVWEGRIHLAAGNVEAAEPFVREETSLDARLSLFEMSGRLREAEALLDGAIAVKKSPTFVGLIADKALLLALTGGEARRAEAKELSRRVLEGGHLRDPQGLLVVLACSFAEDIACAKEAAAKQTGEGVAHLARAFEARANGDGKAALVSLVEARRMSHVRYAPLLGWLEAEWRLDAGDLDGAEAAARRALDVHIYTLFYPYGMPRARLVLARTLEAKGRHAEAAAEYQTLRVLWKRADPAVLAQLPAP